MKKHYIYIRNTENQKIGVLAVEPQEKSFKVAFSLCSGTDKFDPKTGVARACGRLNSTKQSVLWSSPKVWANHQDFRSGLMPLVKDPRDGNPIYDVDFKLLCQKFVSTFIDKKPRPEVKVESLPVAV